MTVHEATGRAVARHRAAREDHAARIAAMAAEIRQQSAADHLEIPVDETHTLELDERPADDHT